MFIYNYLCSENANKLFYIYEYIKFDKELYIWTEKYGWKSKSMCHEVIKPAHLLSSLNVHFNDLINTNKTNLNNLLYAMKLINF